MWHLNTPTLYHIYLAHLEPEVIVKVWIIWGSHSLWPAAHFCHSLRGSLVNWMHCGSPHFSPPSSCICTHKAINRPCQPSFLSEFCSRGILPLPQLALLTKRRRWVGRGTRGVYGCVCVHMWHPKPAVLPWLSSPCPHIENHCWPWSDLTHQALLGGSLELVQYVQHLAGKL